MTCNCESAYCAHHCRGWRGDDGHFPIELCDRCPNEPEGEFTMSMVGAVCNACAKANIVHGGGRWITRI